MEVIEQEFDVECANQKCKKHFYITVEVIEREKGVKTFETKCFYCDYQQTLTLPKGFVIAPNSDIYRNTHG